MLSSHLIMTSISAMKWLRNGDVFAIAQGVTHIHDNTPEGTLISRFHSWPQPLGHSISFLLMPFILPQFWIRVHFSNSLFSDILNAFSTTLTDNAQCPYSNFGSKTTFIACIHIPSAPLKAEIAQGVASGHKAPL